MRLSSAVCIVLGAGCALWPESPALGDDVKPSPPAANDVKLLDGIWNVIAIEVDGKKAPAAAIQGMRWSFKGTELQFADPGQNFDQRASVTLNSSKMPKHVDLVALDGPEKGKSIEGIFKLEKGRLTFCLRATEAAKKGRPKEFKTMPDSSLGMITLERAKE